MNMSADLCTEEEITSLVHTFYDAVRQDPELGPVFAAQVKDWDTHLPRMVDFWSSLLRGTLRYSGNPMLVHGRVPGLSGPLFDRWLKLFEATAAQLPNEAMRAKAIDLAQRIARSLWMGYQQVQSSEKPPTGYTSLARSRSA